MIPFWAKALVVLAFLGGAYWWIDSQGYQRGVRVTEARHAAQVAAIQRDLDAANRENLQASLDLENYRDAARILAEGIENETRADIDVCRVPKPASVQRLQRRWGVPN